MKDYILAALCCTCLGICSSLSADDSSSASVTGEQPQFFSAMQSWVDSSFRAVGDEKARYILERMGCTTASGDSRKDGTGKTGEKPSPTLAEDEEGKKPAPTLAEDIERCKQKTDFYCRAAVMLVDDLTIHDNKYSKYCRDPR